MPWHWWKNEVLDPWIEITAQKNEVPIRDFFSKCDQIHTKLRIWSYLLKNFLIENFIFCAVDPSICLSRAFLWNRSSNNKMWRRRIFWTKSCCRVLVPKGPKMRFFKFCEKSTQGFFCDFLHEVTTTQSLKMDCNYCFG